MLYKELKTKTKTNQPLRKIGLRPDQRVCSQRKKSLPKKYLKNFIFPCNENNIEVSFCHSQNGKDKQNK